MKYKIAIGGIMGVPITFLDKYSNKMGGGTRSSDSQVHQSTLDCLNAMRLSTEETCIIESSFAEKFKIIKFRKGYDEKDMTSLRCETPSFHDNLNNNIKGMKLFYIKELLDINNYKDDVDEELTMILDNFKEKIELCNSLGATVSEVSIDKRLLESLFPTYFAISCAEATSNNSNLTGIIFGPNGEGNNVNDIMFDARTKGFSELIKRRFVLGGYILQKENQG